MDPKKILIVDDDLLSIATISQTLLRNGYQVMRAEDEDRAIRAMKKFRPDLIICNAESKKLDALQLLKTMQQAPQTRGIPFLFITESQEPVHKEAGIIGPRQYLTRPFTREQLAIAVQENLKRAQARRK
jgi:CheY-like chemotaxis protein